MLNTGFLKKEIQESFRTPKIVILLSLFLFFAILSPLTGRYMIELLTLVSTEIEIIFPAPTFLDAWVQFYKNSTSLCLIVYLILMTGSVVQEKNKGSILLVLTKNVSRFNFIFSKFLGGVILFTLCYVASILVSGLYTQILFHEFFYAGLGVSLVLFWLMGVFFTVLAILGSVIAKTPTTAALLGFLGYTVLSILNMIHGLPKFSPAGAMTLVNEILQGVSTPQTNLICLLFTLLGTLAVFLLSYFIFKKQEI